MVCSQRRRNGRVRPGVLADQQPLFIDDLDATANEQRAVRTWLDSNLRQRLLLRAAVEAAEVECARRTGEDGCGDRLGVGGIDVDPRPPLRVEDASESAHAVPDMDAELRFLEHLDRVVGIDTPRAALLLRRGLCHSSLAGSRTIRSRCSGWRRR